MLKQSENIYRFATKLGLLAGLLSCVEDIMTATSIFEGIGLLLELTHPWMVIMMMTMMMILILLHLLRE